MASKGSVLQNPDRSRSSIDRKQKMLEGRMFLIEANSDGVKSAVREARLSMVSEKKSKRLGVTGLSFKMHEVRSLGLACDETHVMGFSGLGMATECFRFFIKSKQYDGMHYAASFLSL